MAPMHAIYGSDDGGGISIRLLFPCISNTPTAAAFLNEWKEIIRSTDESFLFL